MKTTLFRTLAVLAALGSLGVFAQPSGADTSQLQTPKVGGEIPKTPWRIPANQMDTVVTAVPTVVDTYTPFLDVPGPLRTPNEEAVLPGPRIYGDSQAKAVKDQGGLDILAESLSTSWEGIGQTNLSPPDPDIAVGIDEVVLGVNARFQILDKAGRELFAANFGAWVGDPNGFYFDPKVIFDPWRARWIIMYHFSDLANNRSEMVLAVSQQTSAIGNYWIYRFNMNTGSGSTLAWADYYDLGYSAAVVTASGNQFRYSGGFSTAALRWWNPSEIYTGSTAFMVTRTVDGDTPRSSRHLFGGLTTFISSASGGGSALRYRSITDPLGAGTVSSSNISVAAYTVPPNSRQSNGARLDTIDCRMMPPFVTSYNSAPTLFSGLTTGVGGEARCRLYAINLNTLSPILDTDFFATGTDYSFPTPAVNYQNTCVWVFTRVGPSETPAIRYVNWDNGTFSNSSSLLRQSPTNYGTVNGTVYRWGDYFGGDLDWGDYNNQGGTTGRQKLWFYGQYAASTANWATFVGATRSVGTTTGVVNFAGNAYNLSGFVGGPFTPGSANYTVDNSGQVGVLYDFTTPNWLTPSRTGGTLYAGQSNSITVAPNATANSLPYGIYTGNITARNAFTGGTASRTATLTISARLQPTAFTVRLGRVDSGNLNSLRVLDNNSLRMCRFIVPNATTPPVNVEVDTTAPATTASAMSFIIHSRMVNSGSFSQDIQLFDWTLSDWSTTARRVDAITTTFVTRTLNVPTPINRFIRSSDRLVRARWRIAITGPVSVPAWCNDTDFVGWEVTP
ncbi:MAG: hypothetical protein KF884_03900 [Fimbriimonadaceae bacterium]|nr:hypothetical protein [Fimbriimonadaceae bacterium]QYK59232.1 MAG: hypothetical protein KF884_03900 [Fimbriimonadaceae bacterium]